jgi:phosphate transport system substrate-binding protein
MIRWFCSCGAALTVLTALGCANSTPGTAGSGKLVLTGSSTVAPLAAEIGKRFETKHPGVRVDVQTGGSSRGVADARQGLADIGMASRVLKPDEQDLHAFTVARDGVSIIIHADNPVTALTDEQVVAIYTRKIANWKDVGGKDAPITLVHKAEGRSTLEIFLEHFKLKNADVQPDVVIGDNEHGIKTVAGNPNAIGYVSIGAAEYNVGQKVPIKLLAASGVAATTENVRNGTFPIARPLNLVTKAEPQGLAKEFIDFARSAANNDLVEKLYYVPLAK